jgi:siderophore synthetase component
VEFYGPYLDDPAKRPDYESTHERYRSAAPNAFYEMDSVRLLQEMMLDALFFMNLGELALMLADHYEWEEARFWMLVNEVIEEHLERFPHLQERFRQLDLLAPICSLEQLVKRRLYPERSSFVHEAPNPLYLVKSKL